MSTETAPAMPPAPTGTITPPPTAPPAVTAPQTVTIPLEQLQTFTSVQARLATLEAEQRSRDETARAEQVKLLAAKGEIEKALQTQREEAQKQIDAERTSRAAVEERAKRYARDGELSRALASQPLVPGGAEQLTQLWSSQFVVEAAGESFNVRTPTFQTVTDFVKAKLAAPEYAHFIRAQNPAGGTAGAPASGSLAAPTAPANPPPAAEIKTFSDAIILHVKENQQSAGNDGRTNPRVGFGLRAAR
jgi:hypothetical protein